MSQKKLSKRELEEQRKKEDEKATAEIFKDFVADFESTSAAAGKTFVRGSIINQDDQGITEVQNKNAGKLYKPKSKLQELAATFQSTKKLKEEKKEKEEKKAAANKKIGVRDRPKSNLELFKEELKSIQEEREERHRLKKELKERILTGDEPDPMLQSLLTTKDVDDSKSYGSHDTGDPQTTNLYLGNINPKMTEKEMCELFGKFGPLASVKIMWPRSEEEAQRGRNCGFVAYMSRKDGERALEALKGKDIQGFEMKLGWGKAVPIPPQPIYVPPALLEMTLPPPPSGLPFNAQPHPRDKHLVPPPGQGLSMQSVEDERNWDKLIANAVVKVVMPTERPLLALIHRMVEFVVREGPMFEAMIMNREINNPNFRFLFENQSPAHVYYRWKLFSILQGDTPSKWRTDEFRMFKSGSLWRPPSLHPYSQMSEQAAEKKIEEKEKKEQLPKEPRKGQLSNSQRDRLEDMLRALSGERQKIADAMIFCLEHAEAAEEIVDCLSESLSILQTPLNKKIARLYLVSDILYNSSAKVANASFYRKYFEVRLIDIFRDIHETYQSITGRLRAEQFKQRVVNCFRAWEDWALYPSQYLIRLQNIFLGLDIPTSAEEKNSTLLAPILDELDGAPIEADVDGAPLDDLDGAPLELAHVDDVDGIPIKEDDDIDGIPLDGKPAVVDKSKTIKAAPSKWEEVDPTQLEAQAITTSKWELLESTGQKSKWEQNDEKSEDDKNRSMNVDSDDNSQSSQSPSQHKITPTSLVPYGLDERKEERRVKLREIELKVMKYQDELESGKRSRKPEMTLAEQVEYHRKKLLHKENEKEEEKRKEKAIEKKVEKDREKVKEWERAREKDRERERGRKSPGSRTPTSRSRRRSRSSSCEPTPKRYIESRSSSRSPPAAYRNVSESPPPLSRKNVRSRSQSRSPKRSSRSARSPKRSKRSRSRSRSPRHKRKSKKTRH